MVEELVKKFPFDESKLSSLFPKSENSLKDQVEKGDLHRMYWGLKRNERVLEAETLSDFFVISKNEAVYLQNPPQSVTFLVNISDPIKELDKTDLYAKYYYNPEVKLWILPKDQLISQNCTLTSENGYYTATKDNISVIILMAVPHQSFETTVIQLSTFQTINTEDCDSSYF